MADADLPEGWAWTTIGEICSPSKKKVEPGDCPSARYLSLEHIESETGRILGSGQASDVNSTKAVFCAGDVLYGKLRPYLNKVTIPDFDGICSTDILVFPQTDWLLSIYLRHFLSTRDVVHYANHNSSGVQLPRISFAKLGELPFPLPPLAEQKRIVAKVETLLARVHAARQRLAEVPTLLKRFRQSVLAAACSGQLTENWRENHLIGQTSPVLVAEIGGRRAERKTALERMPANQRPVAPSEFDNLQPSVRGDLDLTDLPAEWCWVDLRFLMSPEEPFCYGVVQPGDDDPAGPRLIRVCDVEAGTVHISNLRGIPREVHEHYSRSVLRGGELLVTVVGTIGRSAIAPAETTGMNIARAVAKLPIREFHSRFVDFWLGTDLAQGWMVGDAREVARKTLNLEQLRTLPVPLPPLAEQHEIVRRVEALLARADRIEKRLATATRRVETLTQAILAQAFRGELVPTEAELARQEGRDFESASVLLERIRGERKKKGPQTKSAGVFSVARSLAVGGGAKIHDAVSTPPTPSRLR